MQNLLNNLMYRNVLQSSESQSEASSSAESDWSDINSIALQMGLHPKDLCVERFKVDRQKLENMIKSIVLPFDIINFCRTKSYHIIQNDACIGSSTTEGMNAAEMFFENVSYIVY